MYTKICGECKTKFSMDVDNKDYCCSICYAKHIQFAHSISLKNPDRLKVVIEHFTHFLDDTQVKEAKEMLSVEIL